jgi:hypothetical protein
MGSFKVTALLFVTLKPLSPRPDQGEPVEFTAPRDPAHCHGNRFKSRFPPLKMMPMFAAGGASRPSMIAA